MVASVSRRRFLRGGAAAVLTTAAGGSLAACAADSQADAIATSSRRRYDFEGAHQQGITTPAQEHAMVVALDSVAVDKAHLQQMFVTLTNEIRSLMAGVSTAPLDPLLPPADNLIVGVDPDNDDLTITVGVGASLFDDRYGLQSLKPTE